MEAHASNLVVIAAGYPERMNAFIDSNPGLKERFRYRFLFEDYNPDELLVIFNRMLESRNLSIEESGRSIVRQELIGRYNARDEGFANARMVRNLISDAHDNMAERLAGLSSRDLESAPRVLTEDDIRPLCTTLPPEPQSTQQIMLELNNLVGLSKLKNQVLSVLEKIRYEKLIAQGDQTAFEPPRLHAIFLGSPGTGKTTVAKLMGHVYRAMGLLSRGHVVIVSDRSEVIGRYAGQTAPLVRTKVKEALGGVLFIDEAYNLILDDHDSFGREAIGTLLTEMENRAGQFVLITAGYQHEMTKFLESNSGLRSRFSEDFHFNFEDYSPNELLQIFEGLVARKHFILGPNVQNQILDEFTAGWRERGPKFANGRAVRNYFDSVMTRLAKRGNAMPRDTPHEVLKTILIEDLEGIKLSRGDTQ
jgi:hypothetical protein